MEEGPAALTPPTPPPPSPRSHDRPPTTDVEGVADAAGAGAAPPGAFCVALVPQNEGVGAGAVAMAVEEEVEEEGGTWGVVVTDEDDEELFFHFAASGDGV